MTMNWHIFCRVIDNYGDMGVCWRLARQLVAEGRQNVWLWVDYFATAARFCVGLNPQAQQQICEGVHLCQWLPAPHDDGLQRHFVHNAENSLPDVVIEAFACDLPTVVIEHMAHRARNHQNAPQWINLEYLGLENWCLGCHAMPSPHPTLPLQKTFFIPGFAPGLGGLLREKNALAAHAAETDFVHFSPDHPCLISVFAYPHAPYAAWLESLSKGPIPCRLLLCGNSAHHPAVRQKLGGADQGQCGALQWQTMAFVPQQEYDALLATCHVNLVRGEDSFVRAQWAQRPFIWQAYAQENNAQREKLDAFFALFAPYLNQQNPQNPKNPPNHNRLSPTATPMPTAAARAFHDFSTLWNGFSSPQLPTIDMAWQQLLQQLPALARAQNRWLQFLCAQPDLMQQLLTFTRRANGKA